MVSETKKIGCIGAGNVASALIKGLVGAKLVLPENLTVSDPHKGRLDDLNRTLNIQNLTNINAEVAEASDIIVIAVKPQVVPLVMEEIGDILKQGKLLVSVAAGVKTEFYEQYGRQLRIVRVMPNIPVLVGEGAAAVCGGKHTTEDEINYVLGLFQAVGKAVAVEEKLMDAVTGLSGSGPAFVFKFIEALTDAGVRAGFSRTAASLLAAQTVYGAAKMVMETGMHPMALKDMVTSPAGTTIEGIHSLEKAGFAGIVMDAVEAASKRSEELGKK